jgi:hypothetical protein
VQTPQAQAEGSRGPATDERRSFLIRFDDDSSSVRTGRKCPPGELAEEAALEEAAGRVSRAKELYAAAFERERQAAERLDASLEMDDAHGMKHRVIVPEGMMDDIVRPLWDFEVRVRGTKQRDLILLQDISKTEVPDTGERPV